MAHIVILGAGLGGLPAAFEFRQVLEKQHKVTVVNANDYFQFVPSNPWLAVGWRTRDTITIPLRPILERRNINLITGWVEKIDAEGNKLLLKDGEEVESGYYPVIPGNAQLDYDKLIKPQ